jgi:hypothetical protein
MAEDLNHPVDDHGNAGSGGNCAAGEAERIVAEEQRRPQPVFAKSLKEWHLDSPGEESVVSGQGSVISDQLSVESSR